jgi:hypothetical protein
VEDLAAAAVAADHLHQDLHTAIPLPILIVPLIHTGQFWSLVAGTATTGMATMGTTTDMERM